MTIQERAPLTRSEEEKVQSSVTPRFSVILCTYNRRNFVMATLVSLRRQTIPYRDFEVIVVDNGSRDGTLSAIQAYLESDKQQQLNQAETCHIRCLSEPKNGLAYARNAGLIAASGEIVVFVDDDTLPDPHMLEHLWQAYEETGADGVGMRVAVHWDMERPHWLINELVEILGDFSPGDERSQLTPDDIFASCAFSVKLAALRSINYFSPFLSKRANLPASAEIVDLCLRLHQAGHTLWYEPQALVLHRATSARLRRAFFVGRAYWEGRSAIMLHYRHTHTESKQIVWRELLYEFTHFARCLLVQSPLIQLAARPTTERLLASMEQSNSWGRLIQRLIYLERIPQELDMPAVLIVHSPTPDASFDLLTNTLARQEVRYITGSPEIPLGWLWRHRMYRGQPVGVLHFHRPGALELTDRQNQYVRFRLWLARRLGLRIVVTDSGGWWQSMRGPQVRPRRVFERKLIYASHALLNSTCRPNLLYRDRRLRRRARGLPLPGFRGYYPPALSQHVARHNLGIPATTSFVYLCLAHLHTEREIVFLLEAFRFLTQGNRCGDSDPDIEMLLVGRPAEGDLTPRIMKLVARNSQVRVHMAPFDPADLPMYMGACNAQVLPHLAVHTAGSVENASLALSYDRLVIVPDLPRFSGMLPPRANVPYIAASRESLAEALVKAQEMTFTLREEEYAALDARRSWEEYTRCLVKIYRGLLGQKSE
jgi:glycosyltransferase involved in cell wall biosynthesis